LRLRFPEASRRGRHDIEDLGAIDELGGPFDLVLMSNVPEYLRRPVEVLSALREVAEPDGRLVVSVPNMAHVSVRRSHLAGRFDYTQTGIMDTTHLRLYTRSTLRTTLQEARLRVTREASSPGLLAPTVEGLVIRRLARRIPGLLAVHLIAEARPC
jgi:2-polyprenyl-3-methyl-5-hydroxy-6-metoxy-1,4-benzoquinol methylase